MTDALCYVYIYALYINALYINALYISCTLTKDKREVMRHKRSYQFIRQCLYLMLCDLHPLLVASDAYDVRGLVPARDGDLGVGGLLDLMELGSLLTENDAMMLLRNSDPGSVL